MRTTARFVTPSDFKNFTGIDLDAELADNGTEVDSNKASLFLMKIEDRLLTWCDVGTFRLQSWDNLTEYQTECLQKAILYQAEYVFRCGNTTTDSGYDPQKGKIADKSFIDSIEICRASIDLLKVCGLCNHVMKNHIRWPRVF